MENWGNHQFNNSLTLTNCMSQLTLWNLHTKRGLNQQNRPVEAQKDEVSGDTQLHICPTSCYVSVSLALV